MTADPTDPARWHEASLRRDRAIIVARMAGATPEAVRECERAIAGIDIALVVFGYERTEGQASEIALETTGA